MDLVRMTASGAKMKRDSVDGDARRLGIWLIGGLGSLATTVIAGALSVRRGLAPGFGMLDGVDPFTALILRPLPEIVFGGHEIRRGSLQSEALAIASENGSLKVDWIEAIEDELYRQGALDDMLKQDGQPSGGDGDLLDSFERPILF